MCDCNAPFFYLIAYMVHLLFTFPKKNHINIRCINGLYFSSCIRSLPTCTGLCTGFISFKVFLDNLLETEQMGGFYIIGLIYEVMISLFYSSFVLFISSIIYLFSQKQITAKIYLHIVSILIIFSVIMTIIRFFDNSNESYFFIIVPGYIISCFLSIYYILKKYFQCVAWLPRLLFSFLAISMFYIPFVIIELYL